MTLNQFCWFALGAFALRVSQVLAETIRMADRGNRR